MKNKRGSAVVFAIALIVLSFLLAVFLGVAVYSFSLVNEVLSVDVEVGQVNLEDTVEATFGQISTALVNNADTIGIILLLSMCLTMMFSGYYLGSKNPKMFFIIDFFLLVLFFIPSIYVSQLYNTFISSNTVLTSTFIDTIPDVSKFVLNLPVIVGTVGVITMILSYSGIRKDDAPSGEVSVLGF